MKKHTGLSIIIGGLVIVVLFAAYVSYKSYSNIGVGDDPKVETTEKAPAQHKQNVKKNAKKDNHPGSKPDKKDSNIFLQDTKNPDRIIAIHPYGSKGIYLYRKQANGSIYPEYKYFNGDTSLSHGRLIIKPTSKKSDQSSFDFDVHKDGTLEETSSDKNYQPVPIKTSNGFNNQQGQKSNSTPMMMTINGEQILVKQSDTLPKYLNRISKYLSNPTQDNNSAVSYVPLNAHDFIKLKDGNYYDTQFKKIYGANSKEINLKDFYNNPQKYIDQTYNIKDDVMYYKQNGQTQVGEDSTNEYLQWASAMAGTGSISEIMPKFTQKHKFSFDDTKPEMPPISDQVDSTN